MINSTEIKKKLDHYYSHIKQVDEYVIKCQRSFQKNKNPYQIFYFDFSDNIQKSEIQNYTQNLIAEDYYAHSGQLQWNFYLAFIIELEIDNKLRESIEQNDEFARKYIIKFNELDNWLKRKYELLKTDEEELPEDLVVKWRNILSKNGLEAIFTKDSNFNQAITNIISGKNLKKKDIRRKDSEVLKKGVELSHISAIDLGNFRNYPRQKEPFKFSKVNLISGSNGSGKTSLLEAVEYFICGKNLRTKKSPTSSNIRLSFQGDSDFINYTRDHSLFRARDRYWYKSVQKEKGSGLYKNFNRFNFFNTDAAFILSNDSNSEEEIQNAFSEIAFGEEINFMTRQINNYSNELKKEERRRSKLIEDLKIVLSREKEMLKDITTNEKNLAKLFKEFERVVKSFNWRGHFPISIKESLAKFEIQIVSQKNLFNSLLRDIDWIGNITWNSLEKEGIHLTNGIKKINRLMNKIDDYKKQIDKIDEKTESMEYEFKLLSELQPYYSNEYKNKILGLSTKIRTQQAKVSQIVSSQKEFNKIKFIALNNVNVSINIGLKKYQKEIDRLQKEKSLIENKIAVIQEEFSELDVLISKLKFAGKEFININDKTSECPLCNQKYKTHEELVNRITQSRVKVTSSNTHSKLTSELSRLNSQLKKLNIILEQIHLLRSIVIDNVDLKTIKQRSIPNIIEQLRQLFKSLIQEQESLKELEILQRKIRNQGMSEDRFIQIKDEYFDLKETQQKLDSIIIKNRIAVTKNRLKISQKNLFRTSKLLTEKTIELKYLVKKYEIESDYNLPGKFLEKRKNTVKRYLKKLVTLKNVIDISRDEKIENISYNIDNINLLLDKVKKHKILHDRKDIVTKNANDRIKNSSQKIMKMNEERNRIRKVLNTLFFILEEEGKEKYLERFITENKKDILETFINIHKPEEFVDLNFQKGKILLERYNSLKPADLSTISSGQRTALALSIFLTLNKKLTNGPDYLLFDDPISFTDDLNILSFLDHLRELAINTNNQIFFATANENLAFLFRKKFEFLGEDFRPIYLHR